MHKIEFTRKRSESKMISYIGGKSRMHFILDYIPDNIESYAEPFGGMMWIFYRMDLDKYKNLKKVIYNDFNPLNCNLFNCVRDHAKFSEVLKDYPNQDGELFYTYQKEIYSDDLKVDLSVTDYHLGAKYALVLSQVFSGLSPKKAGYIDLKGKYKPKFQSFKDKLLKPKWQEHFDRITDVYNLDFEVFIKTVDTENGFIYIDPPYKASESYYSNHVFGSEDHQRLSECLKSVKGKVALSYYMFPELKEWYPEDKYTWVNKDFYKSAGGVLGKKQNRSTELLIMNYKKDIETLDEIFEVDSKIKETHEINPKPDFDKIVLESSNTNIDNIVEAVDDAKIIMPDTDSKITEL